MTLSPGVDRSFNSPGMTIAGVRLRGTKYRYLKRTHAKLWDEAFLSGVIEV